MVQPAKQNRSTKVVVLATDREEFDQQPDEPNGSFQCFVMYRDLGWNRTIREVVAVYHKQTAATGAVSSTQRNLQAWSSKWSWVARASSWDRHVDKHRRQQALNAVIKMRARHTQLGKSIIEMGGYELVRWLKKLQKHADNPNLDPAFTVNELVKVLEAGVKLERMSRGEPETIVEERHKFSADQEREALQHVLSSPESMDAIDTIMNTIGAKANAN